MNITTMNDKELKNFRRGLTILIEDIFGYYTDGELNRKRLVKLLNRIANFKGCEVDTRCKEEFYLRGEQYTIEHIKISDCKGFVLRIAKMQHRDGSDFFNIIYDEYDLLTQDEIYAIDREEALAEQTMNNWANGFY